MAKQRKTWRTITNDKGERWWTDTVDRVPTAGNGDGNPRQLKILNVTQDKPYLPRDAK